MCGIAGIYFKKDINTGLLKKFEKLVNESQDKRGPDEFNVFEVLPNMFFFHNMLSIIDLGNARQPMDDENGVITYNGEIYNYKDLKYEHESYIRKSDKSSYFLANTSRDCRSLSDSKTTLVLNSLLNLLRVSDINFNLKM